NTLYHFQIQDGFIPYMFLTPENEFYFQRNAVFKKPARNLIFNGNTSDTAAIFHQTKTSCLRVLDEVYTYDPLLDEGSRKLIPMSNLSRIIPESASVSPD